MVSNCHCCCWEFVPRPARTAARLTALSLLPSPAPSHPTELRVKYFDTIPACTSLCLMRKGFLFAASEFGDHALYQFSVREDYETYFRAAGWLALSSFQLLPSRRPGGSLPTLAA